MSNLESTLKEIARATAKAYQQALDSAQSKEDLGEIMYSIEKLRERLQKISDKADDLYWSDDSDNYC